MGAQDNKTEFCYSVHILPNFLISIPTNNAQPPQTSRGIDVDWPQTIALRTYESGQSFYSLLIMFWVSVVCQLCVEGLWKHEAERSSQKRERAVDDHGNGFVVHPQEPNQRRKDARHSGTHGVQPHSILPVWEPSQVKHTFRLKKQQTLHYTRCLKTRCWWVAGSKIVNKQKVITAHCRTLSVSFIGQATHFA